jgi:hypothetical protein
MVVADAAGQDQELEPVARHRRGLLLLLLCTC